METLKEETLRVQSQEDVVHVRQAARSWAQAMGFSLVEQTKIVTATSEIARNTLDYGGGGTVRLSWLRNSGRIGLRLEFVDQGPGIADLSKAMKDGYTTGNGLGLGLSGSRRLMTEFELQSKLGEGTRVRLERWR
jgi:serine/threonine-protein kinase RsbT